MAIEVEDQGKLEQPKVDLRMAVGTLYWLSNDSPDIKFAAGQVPQGLASPMGGTLAMVKRPARYLKWGTGGSSHSHADARADTSLNAHATKDFASGRKKGWGPA